MGRGRVLAAVSITVALAGCGSGGSGSAASGGSGPQYTYWSNPCVKSRIANGDWQQNMVNYQIPLVGAAWDCSQGIPSDDQPDPNYYIGPNTSGWDWHGTVPGVPNDPLTATPPQSALTPPQQFGATGASPTPAYTPSTNRLSVGCPTSRQLLVAWNAAPATARDSWFRGMTPTRFFGTECWHQWIVTNPVIQANGPVVFTDTGGQLSLLPQTGLSELDAAICGIPGAPSDQWAGPGGPATCQ